MPNRKTLMTSSIILLYSIFLSPLSLGNMALAQVKKIETPMPTAEQEETAQGLFRTLRCMVCDGQTLDGSNADIAVDMRILIREKLQAGSTPQQIRDYLVSRYGESISADPTFNFRNSFLWIIPWLFLFSAVVLIFCISKKNKKQ